jgi:hypothetical protein
MYYSKIGQTGSGFTNQIFALVTSIINAYKKGYRVVLVDDFLDDISKKTYTPISKIFDIEKTNIFLKENYDIIIIDKNNIQFDLISFQYGTNEKNYIDLTDVIKKKYFDNNKLFIDKNTVFNEMKGDPCPSIVKNIIIKYKINNYYIEQIYNENLDSNIVINFDGPYIFTLEMPNSFNDYMFEKILKNISYHNDFITKSQLIINHINKDKKINIIHLRLEDDGILHWSKQNNIKPNIYKYYLEKKYINLIKTYLSKSDQNIILSSSLSNGVIDFLNTYKYNYMFTHKFFSDREKNALVDLLVSKYCNNIFIGNCAGSTFSDYIRRITDDNIVKIYINLDKINDKEVITKL